MLSRTVEVQIDVVDRSNKPPVWDNAVYGPIYVKENTAVGQTVTSVKARCVSCVLFVCWGVCVFVCVDNPLCVCLFIFDVVGCKRGLVSK